MRSSLLLVAYAAISAHAQWTNQTTDTPTIGVVVDGHGITRIYGDSFGRPGFNDTYDYVIIGGGNAGNVIAARLALDPAGYSVAVVEQGTFYEISEGNRTQVPGLNTIGTLDFPIGQVTTETAIMLPTTPQAGYVGRQLNYITGSTFGGGSAANYMGFQRGTVGTFDQWAEEVGDDFWNWDNVLPAYKKTPTFQPPDYTKLDPSANITWDPSDFSPDGGPLHVSYSNYVGPYGPALSDALDRAGIPNIGGFNSGRLIGHGSMTCAVDTRTSTRDSSETSFLQAAARGSSIKIYPNTIARRILFDDDKKAVGVEVQPNSLTASSLVYNLTARNDVILSAGVWHSPQVLMLSGIGPASTLNEHNIPVVADLPGVGQNEWDHPILGLGFIVNVTTRTQYQLGDPEVVAEWNDLYYNQQKGPLAGVGSGQAVAYEKFPNRRDLSNSTRAWLDIFPSDWPEVEYLPLESGPVALLRGLAEAGIPTDSHILAMSAILTATKSRGNMTIASADILDHPVISPNWLLEEEDLDMAYAAFQRIRAIASKCSIIQEEIFPGRNVTTPAQIRTWLRREMELLFHGSSTCKMGPGNDTMSVLDSRARVRGVTGLRVVDASAFPSMPPGQPMASVYMFAEKIAESILGGN